MPLLWKITSTNTTRMRTTNTKIKRNLPPYLAVNCYKKQQFEHEPTVLNRFVPRPPRWFWSYKHGTQSLLIIIFFLLDLTFYILFIAASQQHSNKKKLLRLVSHKKKLVTEKLVEEAGRRIPLTPLKFCLLWLDSGILGKMTIFLGHCVGKARKTSVLPL